MRSIDGGRVCAFVVGCVLVGCVGRQWGVWADSGVCVNACVLYICVSDMCRDVTVNLWCAYVVLCDMHVWHMYIICV